MARPDDGRPRTQRAYMPPRRTNVLSHARGTYFAKPARRHWRLFTRPRDVGKRTFLLPSTTTTQCARRTGTAVSQWRPEVGTTAPYCCRHVIMRSRNNAQREPWRGGRNAFRPWFSERIFRGVPRARVVFVWCVRSSARPKNPSRTADDLAAGPVRVCTSSG